MKRPLMLLLMPLLFCSCSLLPKGGGRKPDCSQMGDLHPKNEALCLVQTLLKSKKNKELNKLVGAYQKMGLQSSNEYNVLFVGGEGKGEELTWTYLVGVDYYDLKVFRSVLVVVNTYASGESKVKEVFAKGRIEDWVKK